jgi:succinoglycan biosynthesis transport protein ExoP
LPQYDINLREYWRVLKKRKFIVIFIALVLGIFSTSLAILKAPTPLYTTSCSIEFESEPHIKGVYSATISWSDSDDVDTQVSIIKGYTVFQKVAEKLRLVPAGASQQDGQLQDQVIRVIEGLQSKVEVEREGATSILNIKVTDTNPVFAQKLANTIALAYKELHAEDQMKRSKETMRYIGEQLTEVRGRLREAEDEFNRFSQDNELISIDLQSENLLARVQEIQDEIRRLGEDKSELGEILGRLNGFVEDPSGSGHDFYSSIANTQYQSTYDKLVSLLLKKDTLLKNFTPKHPEVQAISYEIMENARKMGILLQLQIGGIEKKEIDLGKELEKVNKKTKLLMDKKLEFNRLKRKVDLYTNMASLLEQKNQEALIKRAERPEEVKIVKPALLPTEPINPPKTAATGAAGVMICLVLGIVIGFVVETFDTSLGAIEDVEETLGTQVLGIVPQADIKDMIEGLKEKYPGGISLPDEKRMSYLVSHFVPKSMMSESFRALRTNVQFKDAEKKAKAIAVTSSSPQEGKTLVAVNLAIAMAQGRTRVLLVGSDLRKPAVDKVFDLEMTPGLTDILMESYQWRDTVKTVMDMAMGELTQTQIIRTPGLDNLHVITSGAIPPNPAELIDSPALTGFIEEAKEDYDMIIFDSPPILSTADAAILGAKVDGVLLVYRVGSVSKGLLKRSVTQLHQVKSNIMGVILNGMRPEVSPDFQDYKYYSYYYSYGEEGKDRRRRDLPKGWAFLGGRKGKGSKTREAKTPAEEEQRGGRREGGKKVSGRRLLLLFVATAVLALGILWHNSIIDPFKAFEKQAPTKNEETKPDHKTGVSSETGMDRGSRSRSVKSKRPASVAKPKVEVERSISEEQAKPKSSSATESSAVKKGISRAISTGKSKGSAKEPLDNTLKAKSATDNQPALSMSEPVPKKPVGPETSTVKKSADRTQKEKPDVISKEPRIVAAQENLGSPAEPGPPLRRSPVPFNKKDSYPYSLLLYHFRNLERAREAVSRYSKKGLSAYWVKVGLSNGLWYRVFVGYFEGREQAKRFRKEHGFRQAVVKRTAYATLINTYESREELGARMQFLEDLGYSPYVIEDNTGVFRLYVGTFITKEGAENQQQELESEGVQSQIVKR